MTTQDRSVLRTVIVPSGLSPSESKAAKLLRDLGHDVFGAETADQAMSLLRQDETDLMVVDVSNSDENRTLVQRLSELETADRPRTIAIFSDSADQSLRDLRKRIAPSHVHVFLKPLHMHGLLSVLRQMESESDTLAGA